MGIGKTLAVTLLALAPIAAPAQTSVQTYRCVGKDGKKYYGQTIPQACTGQALEILNAQGQVVHRIDPQASEKQRQAKEAEAAKKREEDKIAREERRRNNALLATYTSEKDIEDARGRALAENTKALKQVEARIADIRKRQAGFEKEMEFYREGSAPAAKGKAAGKGPKPPPKLLEDIRTAEVDLRAQQNLLAAKQKEIEGINAKYDEDKRRFVDLTQRK